MSLAPLDVQFRVLGPLEVSVRRVPVALGGHKQRTVLAVLLLHLNEVVSTDQLIDAVWRGAAPPTAEATLRGSVWRLRASLQRAAGDEAAALIIGRSPGYVLSLDRSCTDAGEFEMLCAAGAAALPSRPAEASRALRSALQLWRGPAFVEFVYDDFADQEIARLEELRLVAIGHRIDADLLLGDQAGVVAELQSLTREYPIREQFHVQLMRALAADGRRPEALQVYERAAGALADQFHIRPGAELELMESAVRDGEPSPIAPAGTDKTRLEVTAPAARLPSVLSSFIGRYHEMADVTASLDEHRLTTITGTGGSGKTRLALEVAAEATRRPGRRVLFVEVADTGSGSLTAAVAAALGVRAEADDPLLDVLVDALSVTDTLFVLDNCEHLIVEAAELVASLLQRCPGLVVLATSRQPLGVRAERVWPIPPLSLPDPESRALASALGSDAVRLFAARAASARADVALSDDDVEAIVTICRRLDGLPLAIELAAARLTVLSPIEIADRLDHSISVLRGGPKDSPERHRGLEATMDWSFRLLSPSERRLFVQLSVFRGAFTLDSARAVAGDGDLESDTLLDVLSELVNKSLVVPVAKASPASFRLLQTMRHYGAKLAETAGDIPLLQARHAAYFTHQVRATTPQLRGPDAPKALDWLDGHIEDIHGALAWLARDGDASGLLELAGATWPYWDYRFLVAEGRQWLDQALASEDPASARSRLAALAGGAKLAWMDDDPEAATRFCKWGLALADDLGASGGRGPFLVVLGELARQRGDQEDTVGVFCEEAVRLLTSAGDLSGAADAMRVMALYAWDSGQLVEAESLGEQCLDLWDRCGDVERSAGIRSLLGGLAVERGHFDEAQRRYEGSLELFHQAQEPWGTAHAICCLGALANLQADPRRALTLGEDSLERHRTLGARRGVAKSLKVIGDAGLQLGWLEKADRSGREALSRFRERGFGRDVEGALLSVGAVALRRGQLERARRLLEESLVSYRTEGSRAVAAVGLNLLGVIAVRQHDLPLAAELLEEGRAVALLDPERGVIGATVAVLLEQRDIDIDLGSPGLGMQDG